MVSSKGASTARRLRLLLVLTVALCCIKAARTRSSPQAVKQHRSAAAKRASLHAAHDSTGAVSAHAAASQRPATHAAHNTGHTVGSDSNARLPAADQLQAHHFHGALHAVDEEQQRGSWVGIAALPSAKTDDKDKPRKHKKPLRHGHHHSQQSNEGEGKPQLQTGFEAEQQKPAVNADSSTKDSVGVWNTISTAPQQPASADGSSSSNGGSSGSGNNGGSSGSTSGSTSGSNSSGSSGSTTSIGSVTQFTRVLKITYEGTPGDTGVVKKQSLAAAALEWSLTASSPDFDDPTKAAADGSHGHWQLTVDQEVPLMPVSGQPYLTIHGNASYPRSIKLKGKLSSVLEKLLSSDTTVASPSTRMSSQGEVPDSFLALTRSQFQVTACEYSGPCNWVAGPNLGPLLGRLTLSPVSGALSIAELVGKKWMPGGMVEVMCVLDTDQEALVDCPHPESGRTSSTYFK